MEPGARRQLVRAVAIAVALLALASLLPGLRHRVLHDLTWWDAPRGEPVLLPPGAGPPLAPAARVRVVLVDGLAAETARTLPSWSATCARGVAVTMDVGFPTVSLPVEAALWSGLTQQQSGIVFRSDHPLDPPLAGIPAQVPGSRAIAEDHGYIVRSLGFASAEPAADPGDPARDADPADWRQRWQARATAAVASDARLVFVHVLRVDTAGHRHGRDSVAYHAIAGTADAIVGELVAAAPDARWFLLSDHGHIATGGHGGEEREVRQVEACIAGPGLEALAAARGASLGHATRGPGPGPLVHVVDIARAIAHSVGATLDREARGRPLAGAIATPLEPDQAVPATPLGRGAIAIFILVAGLAASTLGGRWWLGPWWLVAALGALVAVRGLPTLSTPMVYAWTGRAMYVTWLPALALAAATTWIGLGRTTLARVVAAQLALPAAAVAATLTVCGGWPVVAGSEVAPAVPHFTAWLSPLLLVLAHGSAAVALAVLGRSARSAFGRRGPAETPRSAPAAG